MNETNPAVTLQIGRYTVAVRAEYDLCLNRNDTADFLNWLSVLLLPGHPDWNEERKEWSRQIYARLKDMGIYEPSQDGTERK